MSNDEKELLIARIKRAFSGVVHPGRDQLLHSDCYDDLDIESFYKFGSAKWWEIPDEVYEYEYAALSFLSPEGYKYYLPGYLIWTLNHLETGLATVDSTIFSLTLKHAEDEDPTLIKFTLSKWVNLNQEQNEAIAWKRFLS
jgi:hypothetical protein